MSKEFFCHYLFHDEFCVWRIINESTREPLKAEAVSEEYDDTLDWCTPAHEVVLSSGSILNKKDYIIREQLQCDEYESPEGKQSFEIS